MFSKIFSCGIRGVEGYPIIVEADLSDGLPGFVMVGYLSQEVKESEQRVRTAMKNMGFALPPKKVTINLSPADVRKEGTAFDLAIAAAVLCCLGQIEPEHTKNCAFFGELGLNGCIKPVKGVLSRVYAAFEAGVKRCFLPTDNVLEGTAVKGVEIVGVRDIKEMAELLKNPGTIKVKKFENSLFCEEKESMYQDDFSEIYGQKTVKRSALVAAAGMHNILFIGPAGTGKTMAAKRLPRILPPLSLKESIEVSKIYSICGLLEKDRPLMTERPFRSPHHSVTPSALVGGGKNPRPGEVSLASGGVLFLDELPEFSARILDLLRQPMEEHSITVARLNGAVVFPADTMVVAAMNPCKCGYYPDRSKCICSEAQLKTYLGRISGPFLDRMDIGVEVPAVGYEELRGNKKKTETEYNTEAMRSRVSEVRKIQQKRYKESETEFNSRMRKAELVKYCTLKKTEQEFLQKIYENYGFSARAHDKILKLARTIADLEGEEQINKLHLSEAISYRSFETKYWGVKEL